jgi:hypothetical protein
VRSVLVELARGALRLEQAVCHSGLRLLPHSQSVHELLETRVPADRVEAGFFEMEAKVGRRDPSPLEKVYCLPFVAGRD